MKLQNNKNKIAVNTLNSNEITNCYFHNIDHFKNVSIYYLLSIDKNKI